jgi:hypothetical protein
MTAAIRISVEQDSRLRSLAEQRLTSMAEVLDAALDASQRDQFGRAVMSPENELRADPAARRGYESERDEWLGAELT